LSHYGGNFANGTSFATNGVKHTTSGGDDVVGLPMDAVGHWHTAPGMSYGHMKMDMV
jgi:hypothetical protein